MMQHSASIDDKGSLSEVVESMRSISWYSKERKRVDPVLAVYSFGSHSSPRSSNRELITQVSGGLLVYPNRRDIEEGEDSVGEY